jgi:hypothetical protein
MKFTDNVLNWFDNNLGWVFIFVVIDAIIFQLYKLYCPNDWMFFSGFSSIGILILLCMNMFGITPKGTENAESSRD